LIYLGYYYFYICKENIKYKDLESTILSLSNLISTKKEEPNLTSLQENNQIESIQSRFLNKIFNPLAPPENVIPEGGFFDKGYDSYINYQALGFITNENGQFPIFGRKKYPGRSDLYQYYTINEGRNAIKIPFNTKNYQELYDGDSVNIPELSGHDFEFKKYENERIRYNPNII
jgi:hypothetical protein